LRSRLLLFALLFAAPRPAGAQDIDRIVGVLELTAHPPYGLDAIGPATEDLRLSTLRPVLHEVSLLYGAGISELHSEILMRLGYRFAAGDFPAASVFGSARATHYDVDAVPVMLGWRMTFLPFRVRPLLGVDVGGSITRVSYDRLQATTLTSGWVWSWEGRLFAGAHADVWQFVGARLFVEARAARNVFVAQGVPLRTTGIGIGLAITAALDRPEVEALSQPPPSIDDAEDDDLRQYGTLDANRMDRAFDIIRQADDAKKARDFIEAEGLYRRGVHLLPRDTETRRNVEVAVRVDWAECLTEIGRKDEAAAVLDEALAIDPTHARAQSLRATLPARPAPTADELRR
jgi:hypothetical protein